MDTEAKGHVTRGLRLQPRSPGQPGAGGEQEGFSLAAADSLVHTWAPRLGGNTRLVLCHPAWYFVTAEEMVEGGHPGGPPEGSLGAS